jgi:hypothetical protein
MVALTLSAVIVALVSSVFLTQNNFYRMVVQRSRVQDNLRMVTDMISTEVRGVAGGGVTFADSRRFVVRLPMLMGGVCNPAGGSARMYMPGYSQMDTLEVAGHATRDAVGTWTYVSEDWTTLHRVDTPLSVAQSCFVDSGADTTGVVPDFVRVWLPTSSERGDVIMVFREVEFKIAESELQPNTLAVYRGVTGDTLREFATGITPDTQFNYRLPSGAYFSSVSVGNLPDISAIRVIASATATDSLGVINSYSYGWTVDIPLRNSN